MEQLKISIVTPSYNQGHFIEETIKSVLDQGYDNLEYFIIDGGSTDNTVEVVKKYETKLAHWVSEKDNGQTHAINKGFALATGDIIAWLNSDDMYCKNALKYVADFFVQNPDAKVVVGNELFMNPDGKIYVRKHPNISRWLEKHCMMTILQPSTFVRRSVLTDIGFPKEEYQMMMDAEWYNRINRKYPFHIIDRDLSVFRWHKDSKSSSDRNSKLYKRYMEETVFMLKETHPHLRKIFDLSPKMSFHVHLRIGYAARYLRRLFGGELHKLKDSNV